MWPERPGFSTDLHQSINKLGVNEIYDWFGHDWFRKISMRKSSGRAKVESGLKWSCLVLLIFFNSYECLILKKENWKMRTCFCKPQPLPCHAQNQTNQATDNHSIQDEMDSVTAEWTCPRVEVRSGDDVSPAIGCRCDLAHTLRCTGAALAEWRDIESIVAALRRLPQSQSVSLLDISVRNLSRVVGQGFFDQVLIFIRIYNMHDLVRKKCHHF